MKPTSALLAGFLMVAVLGAVVAETPPPGSQAPMGEFTIVDKGASLDVFYGDQLVTTYHKLSGRKPILWPLNSPKGRRLTRDYPMLESNEAEVRDHIHHRSLWLTHGEVNGVNFWAEEGEKLGTVSHHDAILTDVIDSTAAISGECNWIDEAKKIILKEKRVVKLSKFEDAFILDFECVLTAQEDAVDLGDTKEGTFGIRVAESIRVDAGKGGRIQDSEGRLNNLAWGQSSRWVDYSGPVGSDVSAAGDSEANPEQQSSTAGITVFYHPRSFRYPGRWHVRGYGLFAHNPIGEKEFQSAIPASSPESANSHGGYEMKPGESIRLQYSVLLHDSDWTPEFAERYWKTLILSDN